MMGGLTLITIKAKVMNEREFGAFATINFKELLPSVRDPIKTAMILESTVRALKACSIATEEQLQLFLKINNLQEDFVKGLKGAKQFNTEITETGATEIKEKIKNQIRSQMRLTSFNELIIKFMMGNKTPEEQKRGLDKLNNMDIEDAKQLRRDFRDKFKTFLEGK